MTTSKHFWITRASEALQDAFAAPSDRARAAYLELVHHYCSMHELVHGSKAGAIAPRKEPAAAAPAMPAAHQATPDFRSVHDALMRAA
jgi:hypothetical protein